jgi:hypothetical protein
VPGDELRFVILIGPDGERCVTSDDPRRSYRGS